MIKILIGLSCVVLFLYTSSFEKSGDVRKIALSIDFSLRNRLRPSWDLYGIFLKRRTQSARSYDHIKTLGFLNSVIIVKTAY